MSRHRLTVVLSQAPGKNPTKRALEEGIAAALIMEPDLDVSIVPHLYDLDADHTGRLFLNAVAGDMVVLSWLYPRAAFWLLDRSGVRGHLGVASLRPPADDDDEPETEPEAERPPGIGTDTPPPDRHIYTIDLRDADRPAKFVAEVRRIALECRTRAEAKAASAPPKLLELGRPAVAPEPAFTAEQLLTPPGRRWFPVIDYSRCTNCLECLDFCLFGVYGVTGQDRILVENQDNCKKGCPACSRVCPSQAIMFPDYKTPAIAGAPGGGNVGGLKIDLSRLFGGGEPVDPLAAAVAERDRELVADGRNAVGTAVGLPKRQAAAVAQPKDDLDKLMDDLDALGL